MSDTPPADQKADHKPKKTPHGKHRIATLGDVYLNLGEAHDNLVIGPEGAQVTDAQYQAALELAGVSGSLIVDLTEEG